MTLANTTKYQQPLSPFLGYRWQYTMALSFLHRFTGCALSVGLLVFVYWLVAAATGADAYAQATRVIGHPLGKTLLFGLSFAFFYHLMNGVRHLVWDSGHGFEKRTARASGWIAFLGALVLTLFFWFLLIKGLPGGAA
jgi:succinate dehydrogenase / fumarate reductase cytochrome b subunit